MDKLQKLRLSVAVLITLNLIIVVLLVGTIIPPELKVVFGMVGGMAVQTFMTFSLNGLTRNEVESQ